MRLDKFSNPIFNSTDLFQALYRGLEFSDSVMVDNDSQIESLQNITELVFQQPIDEDSMTVAEFDAKMQSNWLMPDSYKNMDIETFLVQNSNKEHYQRLMEELDEFKARNMLDLLRWMKYFVDTCTEKGIVWGVGRGSSVASYVLYIIGVHSIDPIEYNLDWRDFLR